MGVQMSTTSLDQDDANELLGRLDELIEEREELDKQIARLARTLEAAQCSRRVVANTIGSMRRIFGDSLNEARKQRDGEAELFMLKGMT